MALWRPVKHNSATFCFSAISVRYRAQQQGQHQRSSSSGFAPLAHAWRWRTWQCFVCTINAYNIFFLFSPDCPFSSFISFFQWPSLFPVIPTPTWHLKSIWDCENYFHDPTRIVKNMQNPDSSITFPYPPPPLPPTVHPTQPNLKTKVFTTDGGTWARENNSLDPTLGTSLQHPRGSLYGWLDELVFILGAGQGERAGGVEDMATSLYRTAG